jgi:hypothetical protein
VIINHVGSAPDRKRRVWICLKSQANARGRGLTARMGFVRLTQFSMDPDFQERAGEIR